MSFLLKLIPEPYATGAIVTLVGIAYLYGNVTGKGTERLRNTVASLRADNKALTDNINNAISIQTAMAVSTSKIRAEMEELKSRGVGIAAEFQSASGPSCVLSSTERMRVKSIRVR